MNASVHREEGRVGHKASFVSDLASASAAAIKRKNSKEEEEEGEDF